MKIPLSDRGKYYRGLLVLIKKDRIVSAREQELMMRFGQALDFDKRFCETAINDLARNPHIKDVPMVFSDRSTAESFVRDGVSLASIDGEFHPEELRWLKAVANANGLEDERISFEIARLAPKEVAAEL